jgi:excinuclease ABC subunit B
MQRAIEETDRRRTLQEVYNREHGITPETIRKAIRSGIESDVKAHRDANAAVGRDDEAQYITEEFLDELEGEMLAAAENLEFERAAALRDRIEQMRASVGKRVDEVEVRSYTRQARGKRKKGKAGQRLPRPKKS